MPTRAEIEASARVLCRIAYYQLPPHERICSADLRIPMKPAMHSKLKPATRSDLKPATVPI